MKEIIVTVDDETHRLAESEAAAKGISVSEMLKVYLHDLTRDAWAASFLELTESIRANNPGFKAADNVPRDELYDRKAYR